jgi:hypothetical protein
VTATTPCQSLWIKPDSAGNVGLEARETMSAQPATEGRAHREALAGPIDYLAVEFPGGRLTGDALSALLDLVSQGIIRILDLQVAKVDETGRVTMATIADLDGDGTLDLAVFEGVQSGLLGDDDVAESAALVRPGDAVGLLLYENVWAGPLVAALRRQGADVIASGRIPASDVLAALDALEAAESPQPT